MNDLATKRRPLNLAGRWAIFCAHWRLISIVSAIDYPDTLTRREQQIAGMLAVGYRNSEIADELQISIKTVDTHRGHVLQKLNLRGNVELVWYLIGLAGSAVSPSL